MNVIVFGANGMLGNYVSTYLERQGYDITRITREDIDLSDFNEYSKLEMLTPDAFINCAGTIKPVASNQDPSKTFMVNSVFPNYLARIATRKQIPCFHITTDCIYSGEDGFYNEDSFPEMLDDYGFSKSLGDYAQEFCMVIRTSIIGEELYNKRSLLEWAKSQKGKEVNGFTNHFWNGVTCLELAKLLHKLVEEKVNTTGILHLFSDVVSKYKLLEMISDSFNLDLKIKPVMAPKKCDRTLTTTNPNTLTLPTLKEQIQELVGFYE